MRTGRPVVPIELTTHERRQLTRLTTGLRVDPRIARRARIILAAAGQRGAPALPGKQIAILVRVSQQTVSMWRRRFLASRIDALLKITSTSSVQRASAT